MDNTTLKTKDLCRIIETCRQAGVTKLKLGSVELEFNQSVSYSPLEMPTTGQTTPKIKKHQEEIPTEMQLFPEQEDELKEAMYSQLLIDDPGSYENQMIYENLSAATIEGESNGLKNIRPRENLS